MHADPFRLTPGKTASIALVRMTQRMAERELGLSQTEFCAHVQMQPTELAQPGGRLDSVRFQHVQEVMQRCLFDGREAAAPAGLGPLMRALPELVSLWSNCPTLGDALASYARFRPLLGEFDSVVWQADGDRLRLVYRPESPGALGLSCAVGNFLLLQSLVRFYGEDATHLDARAGRLKVEVELAAEPHTLSERVRSQLGLAHRRGRGRATEHSLTVHGANLWRPVARHHSLLHQHARGRLDADLAALTTPGSHSPTRLRVQATLALLWQAGDGGHACALLQTASERLGMSRWTLRRHLADEGCRFQELVDALRAEKAQSLLAQDDLSMLEISQQLGFANQSSFSRFYSQRFKHSPSQARARFAPR